MNVTTFWDEIYRRFGATYRTVCRVHIYQNALCHHPVNSNIHSHSHENHELFEIDIVGDNSVHWYPSVTLIF